MITLSSEAGKATVLKADLTSSTDGSVQFGVVLCKWRDEFVTWVVERQTNHGALNPNHGEWSAVWGHYFNGDGAYDRAFADYQERRQNQ